MALLVNLCVNLQNCLCGILQYASAQFFDFLDLAQKFSFLNWKLFSVYSGCQKNVPVFKRFFLQPLMPQYRHSEHNYGKRYN